MNLDLDITYNNQQYPAGTTGTVQVTVTGTASGNTTPIVETAAPGTAEVTVPIAVADTYNYSVVLVDQNSNPLSTPVTGSFAITQPTTVTIATPAQVTASQS
jgi:hypothetical protein